MRVTSTINEDGKNGGGVAAGVYPNPMFMKYVTAKGFDNFENADQTEGVVIPSNYISGTTQTAIDTVYSQVSDLYAESIGPIDTDEVINIKAPAFANFLKGNLIKIAPYASLNTSLGDVGITEGVTDYAKYFKVDTNKFGVMWTVKDGSDNRFYFKVGIRTSGKVVWTAAQIVTGINTSTVGPIGWDVQGIDANKMTIVYNNKNSSNYVSAVDFTVDASGILALVGTPLQIAASADQNILCTEYVATDKIIVVWNTLATAAILSSAALVITKGATLDIKGSRNVACKPLIRYMSDNKLLLCIPDDTSASGNLSGRIVSISGTTMTLEVESTASAGGAANIQGKGLWVISATTAYIWTVFSGTYRVSKLTISGTTATMLATNSLSQTPNANYRILGSYSDGKLYALDLNLKIIYRYDTEGILEKQFTISGTINWPAIPGSTGEANSKCKDLRDGITLALGNFDVDNLDMSYARMISPGVRVNISVNGLSTYTNPGTESFGLVAQIDQDVSDDDQIEIAITNKSASFRAIEVDTLIVTVT